MPVLVFGFLIALLMGMVVMCKKLFMEVWSVGRIKMGYVAVRSMTIAYRMASNREIMRDTRLFSLVRNPQITYVNIAYAVYGRPSSRLVNGHNYEGCNSASYAVGIVLSEEDFNMSHEELRLIRELGYRIFTFPCISHAISAVDAVNKNESPGTALKRVMPVVEQFIKGHRLCAYPQFELFDSSHVQIIIPLSRQISYFVPEAVPRSPYHWYLNSVEALKT